MQCKPLQWCWWHSVGHRNLPCFHASRCFWGCVVVGWLGGQVLTQTIVVCCWFCLAQKKVAKRKAKKKILNDCVGNCSVGIPFHIWWKGWMLLCIAAVSLGVLGDWCSSVIWATKKENVVGWCFCVNDCIVTSCSGLPLKQLGIEEKIL